MRIARIGTDDGWEFAVSTSEGSWVRLSSVGLHAADTASLIEQMETVWEVVRSGRGEVIEGHPPLACPVVNPSKVLAVGLNYMDHIRETGAQVPEFPVVFPKYPSALTGPRDPIVVDPSLTGEADYEAELAVVIGRRARRVPEAEALDHVWGYCVANDVSARDWQRREVNLLRAKSYDTFCPLGPWITTADEVPDPHDLRIRSEVNGEPRQDSTTKEMVFSIGRLIEFISAGTTIHPGDVILTGTPHGVGFAMRPPRFLRPGDVVVCEVEGLGRLENEVVAP
jgi:5-carboxymethyl-2-hydroxymuconate isomerase